MGIGWDIHRLGSGGPIRLGGVDIPHEVGLVGHSDADVLLHAVTDAVLGAAAAGDIGQMFPDTDPAHRGRDSAEMLAAAVAAAAAAGWSVVNVDCVVLAERPKIAPHRDAIRRRVGEIVGVPSDRVGVKAKTAEGLGPVGTGQAIAAQCVVLLRSNDL
ncbi:MAG: 2-C-methyl-D-erythritol 2,4-cyclodiphosphate synthase [Pirellulales bacterium]|nr:2-C-methyl-D-erythritol 2,4-cyclodiphosphate synthase [Pirellulales bacterium]